MSARTRRPARTYRRSPAEAGPPYGLADLPDHIDAWRDTDGNHGCFTTAYMLWRAFTWRPGHPRHAIVIAAHRDPGLGPWEIGWRAAQAGADPHALRRAFAAVHPAHPEPANLLDLLERLEVPGHAIADVPVTGGEL